MKMSSLIMAYPFFPLKILDSGDELIVHNPVDRKEYVLNADAQSLLRLCDGSQSLEEIVRRIEGETGIGAGTVRATTEDVLDRFTEMGLVWWRGHGRERAGAYSVPLPQHIFWDITHECNLRCAHCVVSAGEKIKEELNTIECKRLIDDLSTSGITMVTFSGGEPLIRHDFFDIASHAYKRGMSLAMATNGTLIDREAAQNIDHLKIDTQVSLDGSTAEIHDRFRGRKGAFKAALQGIEQLREAGVTFTIASVFSKMNKDDFGNLLDLSVALGAQSFRLIPFIPFGRGKNSQELEPSPQEFRTVTEYLRGRRSGSKIHITEMEFEFTFEPRASYRMLPAAEQHFYCNGGLQDVSITANGEVLPCSFFVGSNTLSVRDYSFSWIWQNSPILNYLRDIRALDIQGVCHQCQWFNQCRGGCPAANFAHGKMMQPNIHCWVAEELCIKEELSI